MFSLDNTKQPLDCKNETVLTANAFQGKRASEQFFLFKSAAVRTKKTLTRTIWESNTKKQTDTVVVITDVSASVCMSSDMDRHEHRERFLGYLWLLNPQWSLLFALRVFKTSCLCLCCIYMWGFTAKERKKEKWDLMCNIRRFIYTGTFDPLKSESEPSVHLHFFQPNYKNSPTAFLNQICY